jgi:SNF2 family DNA or RNA helicase
MCRVKGEVMAFKGRLISPYQHDGVKWMLNRECSGNGIRGGFLCDEMGLGKTIQLIATILANPVGQTLVVVPKSVASQWKTEVERFAPSLSVGIFDGTNMNWDIVITSYGGCVVRSTNKNPLTKNEIKPTKLHTKRWGRIILDEAHEIREEKTRISKSCKKFIAKVKWVVTGTPVFNSTKDFVNLGDFTGISKAAILGHIEKVRAKYVLRRTKDDLAQVNSRLALPDCDFQNVLVEMNTEEYQLYLKVFTDGQDHIREVMASAGNANMHIMSFLKCLLRIRQVMAHPQSYLNGIAKETDQPVEIWKHGSAKMDKLMELISEHPTEKTIIFSQFIAEMDHIHDMLAGRHVFRIDGSVSQDQRASQIEAFRRAPANAFFIIQVKAGGVGLNLQEATRVYITSPSWNPATEMQAVGRSHRTGQTQRVVVRKLLYAGDGTTFNSVDLSMVGLQCEKAMISANVLDDPRLERQIPMLGKGGGINIRTIRNIFSV